MENKLRSVRIALQILALELENQEQKTELWRVLDIGRDIEDLLDTLKEACGLTKGDTF